MHPAIPGSIPKARPPGAPWVLLPAYHLPRLQRRIEAVLVTPGAALVFAPDKATAAAAALDLADFHEGCRSLPVLPVAMPARDRAPLQLPLPYPGAAPAISCAPLWLPALLAHVATFPKVPGHDPNAWQHAAYRPVPALLDAAAHLYASHGDAHLRLATSHRTQLDQTIAALTAGIDAARTRNEHRILFVTGPPGAGKTLCGLDLAFRPGGGATFLTANPALLHVLRAALIRDAAHRGTQPKAARQRVEAVIQPLHAFRDHYGQSPEPPPDHVLVIDEAQRCWTTAHACSKTRNRKQPLIGSEPAHILDIMARRSPWAAIVAIAGGGQEIHAGEGGLAAWADALATRPRWQVSAPPNGQPAPDPRQRLAGLANVAHDPALLLDRPTRAYRAPRAPAWVDAVLAGDPDQARRLAGADVPFRITRSLAALRETLRQGPGRSGLVATAGARRLRAEGLGGQLWHQDEDAVARWFLDDWPDIRSASALEVAATEFGIQGLELDRVGLCWDLDLARDAQGWQERSFRATAWTAIRGEDARSNKRNAYRVLLTRARRETVIWVPKGDPRDQTRPPEAYDRIAGYLSACGVQTLDEAPHPRQSPPMQVSLL